MSHKHEIIIYFANKIQLYIIVTYGTRAGHTTRRTVAILQLHELVKSIDGLIDWGLTALSAQIGYIVPVIQYVAV